MNTYVQMMNALTDIPMQKSVLGHVKGMPIILFHPHKLSNKPKVLITAAIHGNEPAGALAIARILKHSLYNSDLINASFIPVINPTGFTMNKRYNYKDESTNSIFDPETKKLNLSEEGKILLKNRELLTSLSQDCFLSLHENNGISEDFYIYVNNYPKGDEDKDVCNRNVQDIIVQAGLRYFSKRPDGVYNDSSVYNGAEPYHIENGVVSNIKDGTFEDYMARAQSIPLAITFETPSKGVNIYKRIAAQMDVIYSTLFALSLPNHRAECFELPCVKQTTRNSCGGGATRSILTAYGIDMDEDEINKKNQMSDQGTEPENIVKTFRSMGFKSTLMVNQKMNTLLHFLDQSIPCIIAVVAWGDEEKNYSEDNDGHYIVPIGYDDARIYFEDPAMRTRRGYMDLFEFSKRWHDIDGKQVIIPVKHPTKRIKKVVLEDEFLHIE